MKNLFYIGIILLVFSNIENYNIAQVNDSVYISDTTQIMEEKDTLDNWSDIFFYPTDRFQIIFGQDLHRKIYACIVGYNFYLINYLSIGGEISFIACMSLNFTIRLEIPLLSEFRIYANAGYGSVFSHSGNISIWGFGLIYKPWNFCSFTLHFRKQIHNVELYLCGTGMDEEKCNVINYPPYFIGIGVIF